MKKKVIVSYNNLSEELLEIFKEKYPHGYSEYITKITKPNNDVIFVVPIETDDATYLVKVDVKIDNKLTEEEFDKILFPEIPPADKIPDDIGEDEDGEDLGSNRIDTDTLSDSSGLEED